MQHRSSIIRQALGRQALGIACVVALALFSSGAPLAAQNQYPPPQDAQDQPPPDSPDQGPPPAQLAPDQLDNLVAPIALYPDALLSQILVASTYPLELVEAGQWLQRNQGLQGQQLLDAAREQNWDPSVQALVAFPDVINRLNSNIRWTTDLGDAFLAQQADVMNAVQRLREQAREAGQLNSNPQETIATDTQNGQTAIEIQPANPDVMYIPDYNPAYVWGPPAYGYYPALPYPDYGFGFDFEPPIYIGAFFGFGWGGWGGWGWGPNWFNCSVYENGFFFHHYGFRDFDGRRGFEGRTEWAHNPEHRQGIAYPNRAVANRFGGNFAGRGSFAGARDNRGSFNGTASSGFASRGNFGSGVQRPAPSRGAEFRNAPRPGESFRGGFSRPAPSFNGNSRPAPSMNRAQSFRSTPQFRSAPPAYRSAPQAFRSQPAFRPAPAFRSAPAFHPAPSFNSGRSFSAPRSFGGSRSFSAPRSFGGGGGFHGGGASRGGGRR